MKHLLIALLLLSQTVFAHEKFRDTESGLCIKLPHGTHLEASTPILDANGAECGTLFHFYNADFSPSEGVFTLEVKKLENPQNLFQFACHASGLYFADLNRSIAPEDVHKFVHFKHFHFKEFDHLPVVEVRYSLGAKFNESHERSIACCDFYFMHDQYGFKLSMQRMVKDPDDFKDLDKDGKKLLETVKFKSALEF